MKRLLFLMLLGVFLLFMQVQSQVVNNSPSGQIGADSIAIPFYAADSSGNMVALASGDSVFIVVYYPSGAVAYRDSAAYNGTKITAQAISDAPTYSWKEAVADMDGAPVNGLYSYLVIVKDNTGADLLSPHCGFFQLFQARDYHTALDLASDTSLYMTGSDILDSIRWAIGVGVGSFSFSVKTADVDTLFFGIGTDTLWMKIYTNKLSGNPASKTLSYSDRP